MFDFVMLLLSLICFILAALQAMTGPTVARFAWVAIGLALWVVVPLHHAAQAM